MAKMNKIQDPMKTAQIMKEFEKQNMKMDMTDEMSMIFNLMQNFLFFLITKIIKFQLMRHWTVFWKEVMTKRNPTPL